MSERETIIIANDHDAWRASRLNTGMGIDRALYAVLLDPCTAHLVESCEAAHADQTEADKKWHRARRKAQSELATIEQRARAA